MLSITIGTIRQLLAAMAGKASGLWHSRRLVRERQPLVCEPRPQPSPNLPAASSYAMEDKQLVELIRRETAALNRNNVTRTAAYLEMYRTFPELHWAFLAHMVSRNGGWNMTDLKGEWLPRLLDSRLAEAIFRMLETCNGLIFKDAYPQLRLYAESRRSGRNLFGLLSEFGVSEFMPPFWDRFLTDGNSVPLTEALIVNEQNNIQLRVLDEPYYKRTVLDSAVFRSLPLLQTNQTVFPLWRGEASREARPLRLAGRVLESFADLRERIEFGIDLYGVLFGYPRVLRAAVSFARHVPHTGSRADYWPHRFATRANGKNGEFAEAEQAAGNSPWLSPSLAEAWPDRPLSETREQDWYRDREALDYIQTVRPPRIVDLTHEHLLGQYKLQTAVLLARSFMNGARSRRTGLG
ncbi:MULTISPECIES: DUF2515 family protein [unclassified Cohnella]|uniref:DUF2515 family protein n=1 Tax=unclassified Cohnella TaxID=2636738 RepID=UPI00130460A3|nr:MULTISPECIES: DUF2515 family protein [unclassified Cohnella]